MRSPLRFLSAKLFVILIGVMLVVFGIHTYMDVRTTSANLTELVYSYSEQVSDLIVRSTRYSMMLNQKEHVHQIVNTLANEPGFVGVNIYNKNGRIIYSSDSTLIGTQVDLKAEACIGCHSSASPLESVPSGKRERVYAAGGERVLGLISPIRNEPACYQAACHAHGEQQTVLGVLDVKMSLAAVDARVAENRRGMIASGASVILIVALGCGLFIYRMIRKPIKRLNRAMATIASGDLAARVDVGSDDELGSLAQSFNKMADDLEKAHEELQGWADTLSHRVEEKTAALKKAQAQIVHMEKMASLGTLSASVAHEINNPLFGILTYAKLIGRELEDSAPVEEKRKMLSDYANLIHKESSRCGGIVKGLLDFARRKGGQFEENDINSIIEQTLLLLRHHFEMRQIAVLAQLMDKDSGIICDAKQIQQALMAVCLNGVEAMPQGGTLTVRSSPDGEAVRVQIIDTGIGIAADIMPRIFEPFFTTKEGEAGTGLGLAIVYGIVRRHSGEIEVDSTPGQGTTVTITLPRRPKVQAEDEEGITAGKRT